MKYCKNCKKFYSDHDNYCLKCNRILVSIDENNVSNTIKDTIARHDNAILHPSKVITSTLSVDKEPLLPRCPTCGSTNIKRISTSAKVGNAIAFGILGNKRKQQFECCNKSCGYRW